MNIEYASWGMFNRVFAKICVAGIGNFGESLNGSTCSVEHASGINGGLVNSMRWLTVLDIFSF